MFFFFSLLDHGSPHTTRTNRDDDRWNFVARSRQHPEVKFSFSFSTYHHQNALLSLVITIAVRQVTPALLWKKEMKFSKNTRGRRRSSQKMPGDGAEFSKRPPRHRRNQKPQNLNVWRQIFQKRGKQNTLRNGHISGKKRDNFELQTKIVPREPRPKHSRVAESLPRPQLVIHP